ncbi:MAG: CAP domain-containing protein [Gammaproteobacteria bacterium]
MYLWHPLCTEFARRRASAALVVLALALAAPAAATDADLVSAIQAARRNGCDGRPGALSALRRMRALDRAAAAVASGEQLREAMEVAGYRALQSALLEIRGSDAAITRALAGRGCKDLADPAYREFGATIEDGSAWIVLAAPFEAPAARDAVAVGGRVLELVNQARSRPRRCGRKELDAAPPLVPSEALRRAALAHATDMAARNVLNHAGHDGTTPGERVARAGYRWRFTGENIAAGQPTPERVVADWLESPRHCANIMDPDFTQTGVAFAYEPASDKGIYWAQVFAAPSP